MYFMGNNYKYYTAIGMLLISFFFSYSAYTQETKNDTLVLINKYQREANDALLVRDFETAIISLNKAGNFISLTNNNLLKAEFYYRISELQYNIHNYDKAASEVIKAIAFLKNSEDKFSLAKTYNLYGLILTHSGNYIDADRFLKDADKIFTELNNEKDKANTILAFGILELKKGNPKIAINYFEAAIPIFRSYNLKHQEALSILYESEALLDLEETQTNVNLERSNNALEKALIIIEVKSFSELKIESYKIASQIAIRKNDPIKAENYLQLYSQKKDSTYNVYINAISKGNETDFNVGDLNEIIASQRDDLNQKQRSINFGKMTTGLSIALIIILSLLALSLFKNNNLRAKANDLLKDKNIELTLSKEKAEKASLAKAHFLSTITHELRTPLYAVTGLTHLLLEEDPKPEQKEHLNSLKFSGEYLLSLINNILDLNKLEANKVEIEKTSFSLKRRINDVLISLRKTAEDRKNSLHFEYDESIPDKLLGDPLKLSQVLVNLIGNSVKFTQNGDVYVRVQKLEHSEDNVLLHVEIEDDGVGISKKKQKSIFETFSQGSLQINRKFGGSGLGLSIVKNLLDLMNSKIQLESQLGKGSKFWFDISFSISEELKDENDPNNTIYDIDYDALENVPILVVEDNKINQMITKKILEKNKMKCMVADNGIDAIEMVKENNIEIILMDIHMPGISGIETTKKIREFNKQI